MTASALAGELGFPLFQIRQGFDAIGSERGLFRRFNDVFHYELPGKAQISALLKTRLSRSVEQNVSWGRLAAEAIGLNHAEVTRPADEVLKAALIEGRCPTEADMRAMVVERKNVAARLKKNT